jgi:hypothetical protein
MRGAIRMKCYEKVRYPNKAYADRAVIRSKYHALDRSIQGLPSPDLSNLHSYECPICGHWHIGKPNPFVRKKTLKKWLARSSWVASYRFMAQQIAAGAV